jgi:hypothetical protein
MPQLHITEDLSQILELSVTDILNSFLAQFRNIVLISEEQITGESKQTSMQRMGLGSLR